MHAWSVYLPRFMSSRIAVCDGRATDGRSRKMAQFFTQQPGKGKREGWRLLSDRQCSGLQTVPRVTDSRVLPIAPCSRCNFPVTTTTDTCFRTHGSMRSALSNAVAHMHEAFTEQRIFFRVFDHNWWLHYYFFGGGRERLGHRLGMARLALNL